MYAFCVCVVNTSNKTFSRTQTCAQSNTTAQIFCVNATARPLSLHARLYSPECFIKPSVVSLHLWKNNNRHCWILLALKLSLIAHQQVTHVLNRLDWLCSIFLSFFFLFFLWNEIIWTLSDINREWSGLKRKGSLRRCEAAKH